MRLFHTFDSITELDVSKVLISKRRKMRINYKAKLNVHARRGLLLACGWVLRRTRDQVAGVPRRLFLILIPTHDISCAGSPSHLPCVNERDDRSQVLWSSWQGLSTVVGLWERNEPRSETRMTRSERKSTRSLNEIGRLYWTCLISSSDCLRDSLVFNILQLNRAESKVF